MTASERTWPRLLAALLGREDLTADDARWAKVVRSVAEGQPGHVLDAVLANAAGALAARNSAASAGDFEDAFAAGLDQARAAVGSGAAAKLLDQWSALAGELASPR